MIDDYKRVLIGQYDNTDEEDKIIEENIENNLSDDSLLMDNDLQKAAQKSADKYSDTADDNSSENDLNVDTLEYGTKQAVIEEIYMTDDNGTRSNAIIKGMDFNIHMRVRFNDDLPAPIFAYTIKSPKGIEITGTNSMYEKAFMQPVKKGTVKDITFTQNMSLQGGGYLVSFGVTGFENNDFKVYHRLYDALSLTVVSDKNTVGYYDMNSKVTIQKVDK